MGQRPDPSLRRRPLVRLVAALFVWVLPQEFISCNAPTRRDSDLEGGIAYDRGSNIAITQVHYGIPILQKSFVWDGNGEVDDFGASLRALHYFGDGLAIGGGLTAANWLLPGADAQSIEGEGILRWHPGDGPAFLDLTGGWQQSTASVPPGGTQWNMSFSFGPGLDVPIGERTSLMFGTYYHHISNALGRDNPHNPSQNEARIWVGVAWNF